MHLHAVEGRGEGAALAALEAFDGARVGLTNRSSLFSFAGWPGAGAATGATATGATATGGPRDQPEWDTARLRAGTVPTLVHRAVRGRALVRIRAPETAVLVHLTRCRARQGSYAPPSEATGSDAQSSQITEIEKRCERYALLLTWITKT